MNVSIIIVNYNTTELLLQCLNSVVEKTQGVSYEIIVVDNNSREEELQPLRADKRIRLIELDENVGFGRANNAGAKIASGEQLFMLNPDTILLNDAVSVLYHYLNEHPHAGVCGGNIYDADMTPIHSHGRMRPSFLSELDIATRHVFCKLVFGKNAWFNHSGKPMPVAFITGADMMVRREAWNAVNGFDPSFFMYFEDSDLCVCIQQKGYDIMNVPAARIIHLEGKSFVESRKRMESFFVGHHVFFHKHYSAFYNLMTDALNLSAFQIAAILYTLFGKKQKAAIYRQRKDIYSEVRRMNESSQ